MKKLFSVLLSCMMLVSVCATSFAAQGDELTQAIVKTKELIPVPKTYTEFSYSSHDSKGAKTWELRWTDKDQNNSVTASITDDGKLTSYSWNREATVSKENDGIAAISKEAGLAKAQQFLKTVAPEASATLKLEDSQLNYSGFVYQFNQYFNDIKVLENILTVTVDKMTGDVIRYNGTYDDGSGYPDPSEAISVDDAKKAYLQDIGAELCYRSTYDYKTHKLVIFPAYVINSSGSTIDALTGKAVDLPSAMPVPRPELSGGAGQNMSSKDEGSLSPEELKAVEGLSNLISKEKAEEIAKNVSGAFAGCTVSNASLYENSYDKGSYHWSLSFSKEESKGDAAYYGSAAVNAKTGELISFYYGGEPATGNKISEDAAKQTALEFLKKASPDHFAAMKENASKKQEIMPMADSSSSAEPTTYTLEYVRYVNNVPFYDNYMRATVDRASGKVTSFSSNWYESASFPSVANAKKDTEIFETIAKTLGFGLYYHAGTDMTILSYDFDGVTNALFHPETGSRISGDGSAYVEQKAPVYTDVNGHWCSDAALKLSENNIYLDRSEVKPDEAISQRDFLAFLARAVSSYVPDTDEELYENLKYNGVIKVGEVDPNGVVSRYDAVKFIIRALEYGEVAELEGIYANPFKDEISAGYLGYASLAYGFGIVKGDESGAFGGTHNVTNAETIMMIYNMLTR